MHRNQWWAIVWFNHQAKNPTLVHFFHTHWTRTHTKHQQRPLGRRYNPYRRQRLQRRHNTSITILYPNLHLPTCKNAVCPPLSPLLMKLLFPWATLNYNAIALARMMAITTVKNVGVSDFATSRSCVGEGYWNMTCVAMDGRESRGASEWRRWSTWYHQDVGVRSRLVCGLIDMVATCPWWWSRVPPVLLWQWKPR